MPRSAHALLLRAAATLLLAGLAAGAPRAAQAAKIHTATLGEVLARSSHVALGAWDADAQHFRVERWLRGAGEPGPLQVLGIPSSLRSWMQATAHPASHPARTSGLPGGDALTERGVLLLEQLDGRFHLSGMSRYRTPFGAHAAVRVRTTSGAVAAWEQVINPGDPQPVPAETGRWDAFLTLLDAQLAAHPYVPSLPARAPLPPALRGSFFEALGEAVDWYQGGFAAELPGWGSTVPDASVLHAAAARLDAWIGAAPPQARVHGLDALLLLCRRVQGGGPDTAGILARAERRLADVPRAEAQAWIFREVEHGDYCTNREALGRLARTLGPDPWEQVLRLLEGWVEKTAVDVGSACWFALESLGEGARAVAARERRRLRERAASAPAAPAGEQPAR